jgi:hypothetical protein
MPRMQSVVVHIEVNSIDFEYGLNDGRGITNDWIAVRKVNFEDPFRKEMQAMFTIEWMHHDQGPEGFRYDIRYSPIFDDDIKTDIVGMTVMIHVRPGLGRIRGAKINYTAIGA